MFALVPAKEYPLVHVPDVVLYRYEVVLYSAGVDEFDNPLGPARPELKERHYKLLKRTPKGVWIRDDGSMRSKRFINQTRTKQFAHETREKALEAYIARNGCNQSILRGKLSHLEHMHARASILLLKENNHGTAKIPE